jgi:phage-related baseplate assembly protein
VPFVSGVENITVTGGGSNIEDDESLRNRARQSPGQFSTAGARISYLYWSLTAHGNIGDVSIVGPEDRGGERLGEVDIFVMLQGGGIPEVGGTELTAVSAALNNEKVRPLTDKVNVSPVNAQDVSYTATWFITTEQAVNYTAIAEAVAAAVDEYNAWQTERIGRDINPDRLVQLCRAAGAKRVVLSGLNFTSLNRNTVARIANSEIIFGGVESE